jgi:membrane-bound serine protease (ClpP class)
LINAPSQPFLQISLVAIGAVTVFLAAFFLVLVTAVLRSRGRRVVTGREGLLGSVGVVRRELEPGQAGLILVQGELWQAVAPDGRLEVGEYVVVQAMDGLLLSVRRAPGSLPVPARPPAPIVTKSGTAHA